MKPTTPMKAIRLKCVDCCAGQSLEIKACPCIDCSLWRYRLGRNPNYKENKKNPYLNPKNFVGRENWEAIKLIKFIKEKC
ncbi:hypothetical protein JW930_00255 [Candidatus Woesearchaeota archaeon]|nr:hypothetical protein [Candidatus Woesearchaeota archaeon]